MASSDDDDEEEQKGVLIIAKDTALAPLYLALSKPARRAYISTGLLLLASTSLFALAVTAYSLFYYAYIPVQGFSVPVHLQFSPTHAHHPFGTARMSRNQLLSNQPYNVHVQMELPRTRANREAGNFMLDLQLLGPPATGVGSVMGVAAAAEPEILAQERRPAILTYYSPIVEHVNKAVELPWYMLGWRREAEALDVGMMEGVRFGKGWRNVPEVLRLELLAMERMQVYRATVVFEAKLEGLRYIMYNHRIISFLAFTLSFWIVEMTFMLLAWFGLSYLFSSSTVPKREIKEEDSGTIKTEEEESDLDAPDLSDTSRTFPSYSRQQPLRYSSSRVKSEEEEEAKAGIGADIPAATGQEADDEDEDADFVLDTSGRHMDRDSGLGTSMESSNAERRESVRKRRSGMFSSGSRNL